MSPDAEMIFMSMYLPTLTTDLRLVSHLGNFDARSSDNLPRSFGSSRERDTLNLTNRLMDLPNAKIPNGSP